MVFGGDCVCTLWFLRLMLLGVCWMFLCPLQSLCPALSSGVNHNAVARMAVHPISVPWRQPDLGIQYHPWSKVRIRGTASTTPFNGKRARMGPPESYSGVWGILVHPSPPVQAYLWTTSFIGRIFPGLHTG